jgi:hypothetical protein
MWIVVPALLAAVSTLSSSLTPAPSGQAGSQPERKQAAAPASARVGDPYALPTCAKCESKFDLAKPQVVRVDDGRELRFCSEKCAEEVKSARRSITESVDRKTADDQRPLYPLKTSVISGKDLPEKPYEFVYGNRLIRLVDVAEKAEFQKEPKRHLATLDAAAVQQQLKDYPLTKCVGTGNDLNADPEMEPANIVVAGRLMRLCCKGCRKHVEKEPAKIVAEVDQARAAKARESSTSEAGPKK